MATVNRFAMALASRVAGTPSGGAGLALVLLGWYALIGRSAGLWLWWLVTAVAVGALGLASLPIADLSARALLAGIAASGAVLAFSHVGERGIPPRAGHDERWMPIAEYMFGPPAARLPATTVIIRLLRFPIYGVAGAIDEIWASPGLLPYNIVRLMLD
jgi:hypothetical protein